MLDTGATTVDIPIMHDEKKPKKFDNKPTLKIMHHGRNVVHRALLIMHSGLFRFLLIIMHCGL
jgi:hypothetical protein